MTDDAHPIRAVIVDDEPLARDCVRIALEHHPEVEVVEECVNGEEAIAAIREHRPDLVFLDVQMPGLDGFDVIEEVGVEEMPVVVFVTAYDQHALKAFDVRALDYLLKPFDRDRFAESISRVRDAIEHSGSDEIGRRLLEIVRELRPGTPPRSDRLVIKSAGRLFFLRIDEIDWVEAAGNYVKLHVGTDEHLLRETMNGIEQKLDPDAFFRIHRSRIVNMERIKELQPWFNGEYVVILHNGTKLTLSRGYREKLQERLGRPL
jgi:two-component system LytT family response regulator